jgi:CNT family concentrative nucleoside transporter
MSQVRSLLGIGFIILVAYLFSKHRKNILWKTVAWGFGLQVIFAMVILLTTPGEIFFVWINDLIAALLQCSKAGAEFVFGNLIENDIPVLPENGAAADSSPLSSVKYIAKTGSFFAFSVLPTIIFFSAFMSILYHIGIMQRVVSGIAKVMAKTMRTSGSESLSVSADIFVGQTEAPLVIRPYIESMTLSELHAVMTGGFATIAGGVMAAYVGFLSPFIPNIAGHLMAASLMSAPAALAISKIFFPETETSQTAGGVKAPIEKANHNLIDAAAAGASDGLALALNVAGMLIAFIGIVALINALLAVAGSAVGLTQLSLSWVFGKAFAPIAFILGAPWSDCVALGNLLGTKIVINEFVAYLNLRDLVAHQAITPKSAILASYALCGFANLGSIGIQIGGMSVLAPSRRHEIARLGFRAMIAGTLATFSTACIAGFFLDVPKFF